VPGTTVVVEPGTRSASLLVRIGGNPPSRLSQELAGCILVVPEANEIAR
jgi:hypothetical protein